MSLDKQIDIQVMQMISSRLCHDLVGTVGAINAAVELIEDETKGVIDSDIINLLSSSAREASRKLAFFRTAFGLGGNSNSLIEFDLIRELVEGLEIGGKANFKWIGDTTSPLPNIAAKLVCLLALISNEALPRGGMISIHVQPMQDGIGIACAAEGIGAALRDVIVSIIEGEITMDEVSSREIHAYYAKILAESIETRIELGAGESLINLAVLIPFSSLS